MVSIEYQKLLIQNLQRKYMVKYKKDYTILSLGIHKT